MRYEDRSQLDRIGDLTEGKTASLELQVRGGRIIPLKGGRLRLYEFVATDGEREIRAFWWNQIFLSKVFHQATRVILYGEWRWNRTRAMYEVENPEFEVLDADDEGEASAEYIQRAGCRSIASLAICARVNCGVFFTTFWESSITFPNPSGGDY